MDEAENTTGGTSTTDAAKDADRAAAVEMRANAEKTMNELKSGGIGGIFSFDKMYFPVIARWLFIIITVIIVIFGVLGVLGSLVNILPGNIIPGIVGVIVSGIGMILWFIFTRVWFEMLLLGFKIYDELKAIRQK